ncbi:hypothetical protein D3C84_1093750 [compost metagenome]
MRMESLCEANANICAPPAILATIRLHDAPNASIRSIKTGIAVSAYFATLNDVSLAISEEGSMT